MAAAKTERVFALRVARALLSVAGASAFWASPWAERARDVITAAAGGAAGASEL